MLSSQFPAKIQLVAQPVGFSPVYQPLKLVAQPAVEEGSTTQICYNAMTKSDEDHTSESLRIPRQSRFPMGLIERLVQEEVGVESR